MFQPRTPIYLFQLCCVFNLFYYTNFFPCTYIQNFFSDKFYKTTNIIENNDSYGILLDNSKLKTPLGNELIVNSKALALAVAEEWAMQKEKIQTDPMHLVRLCENLNIFYFLYLNFIYLDKALFLDD